MTGFVQHRQNRRERYNLYFAWGLPVVYDSDVTRPVNNRLHIGKEYLSFEGLHWYDNHARIYDPLLMRFTTPDPLAAQFPSVSPYAYCNNNPINLIDPTGCIVEDPDGIFNTQKKYVQNQLNFLKQTDVSFLGEKGQVALSELKTAYTNMLKDYDALEKSDQTYRVFFDNSLAKNDGANYYDIQSNTVMIGISHTIDKKDAGFYGLVGQELEHGAQFENGELSYDKTTGGPGHLYDVTDEMKSFDVDKIINNGISFFLDPSLKTTEQEVLRKDNYKVIFDNIDHNPQNSIYRQNK